MQKGNDTFERVNIHIECKGHLGIPLGAFPLPDHLHALCKGPCTLADGFKLLHGAFYCLIFGASNLPDDALILDGQEPNRKWNACVRFPLTPFVHWTRWVRHVHWTECLRRRRNPRAAKPKGLRDGPLQVGMIRYDNLIASGG